MNCDLPFCVRELTTSFSANLLISAKMSGEKNVDPREFFEVENYLQNPDYKGNCLIIRMSHVSYYRRSNAFLFSHV